MRILILGGTRFIGPHVATQLAESGHELGYREQVPYEEGMRRRLGRAREARTE